MRLQGARTTHAHNFITQGSMARVFQDSLWLFSQHAQWQGRDNENPTLTCARSPAYHKPYGAWLQPHQDLHQEINANPDCVQR